MEFTFGPVAPFEFIFIFGLRYELRFIFLVYGCSVIPAPFVEKVFFHQLIFITNFFETSCPFPFEKIGII